MCDRDDDRMNNSENAYDANQVVEVHIYDAALGCKSVLTETVAEIDVYEKLRDDRDVIIDVYKTDLINKDAEIDNYKNIVAQKDAMISGFIAELSNKDVEIIRLHGVLRDRDDVMCGYKKIIDDKDAEIYRLQQALSNGCKIASNPDEVVIDSCMEMADVSGSIIVGLDNTKDTLIVSEPESHNEKVDALDAIVSDHETGRCIYSDTDGSMSERGALHVRKNSDFVKYRQEELSNKNNILIANENSGVDLDRDRVVDEVVRMMRRSMEEVEHYKGIVQLQDVELVDLRQTVLITEADAQRYRALCEAQYDQIDEYRRELGKRRS